MDHTCRYDTPSLLHDKAFPLMEFQFTAGLEGNPILKKSLPPHALRDPRQQDESQSKVSNINKVYKSELLQSYA